MQKLIYFGKITDGILKLTNKQGFANDLLDYEGKEVRLTLEAKSKRSSGQNKFFHAVCVPIIKSHLIDLGWKEAKSDEWVKNYIKFKCLVKEYVNEETGDIIKSLGETSALTVGEFIEFIQDVQIFAAEQLGVIIPDPESQQSINFLNS